MKPSCFFRPHECKPATPLSLASIVSTFQDSFGRACSVADQSNSTRYWWPYRNVVRDALALTLISCAGFWSLEQAFGDGASRKWLTDENGAIETIQFLALLTTAIASVYAFSRVTAPSWRSIAFALVCVSIAGASREIPSQASLPVALESHFSAEGFLFAVSSTWKHSVIGIAVCLWIARVAYGWVKYPTDRKLWFTPSFIWPAFPFAACFVLAEVFERLGWVMAEESIETFAYMMMLAVATWMVQNASKLNTSPPPSLTNPPRR